jgi:hypothetical protein
MWIGIITAIVLTVLLFSFRANKKSSRHMKENENVRDDPGADD